MKKIIFPAWLFILITGWALTLYAGDAAQPFIIDVRTQQEWNNGHLEGAILVPYREIGEKIDAITKDKSQKIYVYCRSGRRSQIAKEALEKRGYKDVVNLGSVESAAKTLQRTIIQ